MYLRNAWYVAGWDSEFKQGALTARKLLGDDIVFYRLESGMLTALENRCCHRAAPLSKGEQEGDALRCMYHGLLFDCHGRCIEVPGQERLSDKLRVRAYPVEVRDNLVWIWMGDPAAAKPEDIQRLHWTSKEGWSIKEGLYLHYSSSAQLIADNLLDFSHLGFVHGKSIGTRRQGSVRPETQFSEESVSVRFTTLNSGAPTFARELGQLPEIVDRFNYYVWHIRGNLFVQDSVIAPVGEGYGSSGPSTIKVHTFIALTPETENTAHYFWSTAHNNFASKVSDLTGQLAAQVESAFDEDRQIIEAQQKVLTDAPDSPMIAIAADGTLLKVRRMLDAMIANEQGGTLPASSAL
ncbi:TPA: aromatic ring-hydroxylating dioxygenase subunit alpha [Burkholderia aenigmatica]|uniref:aromatic ring-hydroxylating dioxygenase subunit alpha n=1 Tax=Burkholderia sp. AU45251 TaxID=3059204 RepID=UPI0026522F0B|nr:aromatic ring-hydroxylating dioxygenase subunit alpha [Burkholderia sp. AU45251]HDR9486430.1 aromatic ring-hydroxylating dioxygenase subunit alpha [Burkholderia aenigmatica]MDN7519915.1 aromatic ring-hydroxylating dioxygenase subunit alpha [Burkholderia sp. AU45251]HDR9517071.1 aromatic ring-hydroxylating dioxygenase subunit alpha [Burkholderia aenigmatica]HDR9594850.1 aromatic ring-hydroxylating dioxygenase subunit alpha [Burkholderia aenigmatica]HDR9600165.1 aromatic ring-hydroxylating di